MSRSRRSSTAISLKLTTLLLPVLCLLLAASAFAGEVAGTVTHLSGPLFAKKADGMKKALSQKSAVEQGDTLITEKNTYARIKFLDNSEITLRPNTRMVVEKFSYDKQKPEKDGAVFNLVKGGLRAVSGSVGKRGNQDGYKMKTLSATIGIRGTHYGCSHCQNDCGKLPNGLYVDVAEGAIIVSNQGGSKTFDAGQFGYVPDPTTPPVTLPKDPGIKFAPPATVPPPAGGKGGEKGKMVDCEVR